MKKFLAIVLTLAIVLGLCACGGGSEGGTTDKGGVDGQVTIKIGLATNAKVMSYTDNALTKWLEEQTGYKIEFVEYSGGTDVATQISSTVAARQELPDILWGIGLNESAVSTYGKEGYFVDLTPYYEDKEGASATFWERLETDLTELQQETVIRKITDADTEKIYSVPCIETSLVDKINYMVWINTEWLDALSLEKPTNTQELYDVLVAFRDKDPNGNGLQDEIPLFGAEKSGAAQAINWLINMYLYYDESHRWQDYNGDGQLEFVYTQEEYREALQFVNKLYKEKLLTSMIYTATSNEMKTITTPASGTAICGIFVGHLTIATTFGSEVMYEYEPLELWGCAVESDMSVSPNTFITETAEKKGIVDQCFKLLMTMFSKEGSFRIRYGEKGVNWVEPSSEEAVSDYGLKADYKLLDDPFTQQTTAMWGKVGSTLNHYAEGETAEISADIDQWTATKSKMHAEFRRIFDEAAAKNNPTNLCPTLVGTTEEQEDIDMTRTNVQAYVASAEKDFVCGTNGMDINDDSDWSAFLKELENLGLADYQKYVQTIYDRQAAE